MNKNLLLTIMLIFSTEAFSQQLPDSTKTFYKNCFTASDSLYNQVVVAGQTYTYLFFSCFRNESGSIANGEVLLSCLRSLDKTQRKQIAAHLLITYQLTSVKFFESCGLRDIFYQAMPPTSEQKKALDGGWDSYRILDIQ